MALAWKSSVLTLMIGNLFLYYCFLVFDGARYWADMGNVPTECV